jgi:hypothetical protein
MLINGKSSADETGGWANAKLGFGSTTATYTPPVP